MRKKILLESITNKSLYPAFIKSNNLHKVMTVFASKGLEFDQVISYAQYYDLTNENQQNNHYVSITRAKDKFIMLEGETGYYIEQIKLKLEELNIKDYNSLFKFINHI